MRENVVKVLHCPRNGFPRGQGCTCRPGDPGFEKEEMKLIMGSEVSVKLRHQNRFQPTMLSLPGAFTKRLCLMWISAI